MRKSCLWVMVLVIMGCAAPVLGGGPAPKAVVDEQRYDFAQVVEGSVVTHDFVIRNQGDAPLMIGRVKSDCGCTAASVTRQIPPGGEGKITVKFHSDGYGGRMTRQVVKVETNDPLRTWLELSVSGEVREFASVLPRYVTLTGKAGAEVGKTITILPMQPFTVRGVRAQEGKNIRVSVSEKSSGGRKSYVITVENTMNRPGRYRDTIIVETDSTVKPKITIGVTGEIS